MRSTGAAGAFAAPVHVDFNLTNACNLRCGHCHSSSGRRLAGELTTEEICEAVDELHDLGVLTLAFAGGEPFVRRDLITILDHACSLPDWRVSVITNGLFLTPERVHEMAERCPRIVINVSLDGSTPEGYAKLRVQPGASPQRAGRLFKRVLEGIRVAADLLAVSVNTTITMATVDDLVPTYRLAVEELGAKGLVAIKFFPGGYGRADLERLELPFALWSATLRDLTERKLAAEITAMQLSVPSAWEFYLPLIEHGIDLTVAERAWGYRSPLQERIYRSQTEMGDPAGRAELCIGGDGTIYPSVLMSGVSELECGDVRDHALAAVWQDAGPLTRLRQVGLSELSACGDCAVRELCGGGSRARAYVETGDVGAQDSLCPLVVAAGHA